jgi:hypothetical protein
MPQNASNGPGTGKRMVTVSRGSQASEGDAVATARSLIERRLFEHMVFVLAPDPTR